MAGCTTPRKSTSGGCLSLKGSIIHSWAKQQDTIADSSGESEFIALVYAAKEVMYIRNVLEELGITLTILPNIFIDSSVAIDMIKNNLKGRVKHLDRRYFWVRDFGNVYI